MPDTIGFEGLALETDVFYHKVLWGICIWLLISGMCIFFVISFRHFLRVKGILRRRTHRR